MTRILILQGHPDPDPARYGRALATAYAEGARAAGHQVEKLELASLEFDLLRSKDDHDHRPVPEALRPAQEAIARAEHVVIVFPLWLGGMPALLKGFLEQVLRPGFAYRVEGGAARLLKGRSARIVVTMGMPAWAYRLVFRSHGVKQLATAILRFCGFGPVRTTLIGQVETMSDVRRSRWIGKLRRLGERAA